MREHNVLQAKSSKLLKKDVFGHVRLETRSTGPVIIRDTSDAAPWLRWLARRLLHREATALAALHGMEGVPQVVRVTRGCLERSWIDGVPMQIGKPSQTRYFHEAAKLLRRIHAAGVVHNDLAKEPNLLVSPSGEPAIIDFQLARFAPARGRIFRIPRNC